MIQYLVTIVSEAAIFAMMATGLNVIWGWSGDFDLAYYGYVALGAYMTLAFSIGRQPPPNTYIIGAHVPFILAAVLAMITVACFALLVGLVALRRLRAIYYAIVTLGTVSVLYIVISDQTSLFNGFNGLYGSIEPFNSILHLSPLAYPYFFAGLCIVVLALVFLVLRAISNSPFGRALRSVREEERASKAFGRDINRLKLKAYVIGATVGGLAGAMFAAFLNAFNPSAWSPIETLVLYAGVFIGGSGNLIGVVFGMLLMVVFQEATRFIPAINGNASFAAAVRQIVIGVLIIVILRYRPKGLFPEPRPRDDLPSGAPAGSALAAQEVAE